MSSKAVEPSEVVEPSEAVEPSKVEVVNHCFTSRFGRNGLLSDIVIR